MSVLCVYKATKLEKEIIIIIDKQQIIRLHKKIPNIIYNNNDNGNDYDTTDDKKKTLTI